MLMRVSHPSVNLTSICTCRPAAPAAVSVQLLREESALLAVLYSDASLAVWDGQRRRQLLHVPPVLDMAALHKAPLKLQAKAHDAQVSSKGFMRSDLGF